MKERLIGRLSRPIGSRKQRPTFVSIARFLAIAMFLLPTIAFADVQPRFSLPADGNQFFSQTNDGVGVIGSLSITGFEDQGGVLFAIAVLQADLTETGINESTLPPLVQAALAPDGTAVELPVKITNATCNQLTMEAGPIPGLVEPIILSYSAPSRPVPDAFILSQDLCEIAQVAHRGNARQLAQVLNQSQGPGALKSCGILDALKCAGASVTCASACLAGPAVCILCLGSIGLLSCKECLGL